MHDGPSAKVEPVLREIGCRCRLTAQRYISYLTAPESEDPCHAPRDNDKNIR